MYSNSFKPTTTMGYDLTKDMRNTKANINMYEVAKL